MLFFSAIVYGLSKTPKEILQLELLWLLPATLLTIITLIIQILQVHVFVRHHELQTDWHWIALFTIRKALLNTFMPAKTGTVILLHTLTKRYPVKWNQYVYFMILSSLISIIISAIIFIGLITHPVHIITGFFTFIIIYFLLKPHFKLKYLDCVPILFPYAICMYLTILGILWCILLGFGYEMDFFRASCFAVALNTLAQVAITPGNIGTRETLLGILAPYLSLPISIGILSGAVLFTLRIAITSLLLILLESRIIPNEFSTKL